MEKASQSTLSHSLFFADTVALLFLNTIVAWLKKFHKLSSGLLNYSSREHRNTQSTSEEREHNSLLITREELEVVMGGLRLDYNTAESEKIICVDDIKGMFEEKEPSLEEVRAAFAVFDQNCDGFIDAGELQRVFSLLGIGGEQRVAMESCQEMIQVHDDNRDGRIDFNEFVKFLESSFC